MVANTGKALHTGTFKSVNLPEKVRVEEDPGGKPVALLHKHRQPVDSIESVWRLDDEWWRVEPLSRMYFVITLVSGQRLTVFKDLLAGCWYRQSY